MLSRLSGLLLLSASASEKNLGVPGSKHHEVEGELHTPNKHRRAGTLALHTNLYLSYLFIREISTMVMGFTMRKGGDGGWGMGNG